VVSMGMPMSILVSYRWWCRAAAKSNDRLISAQADMNLAELTSIHKVHVFPGVCEGKADVLSCPDRPPPSI